MIKQLSRKRKPSAQQKKYEVKNLGCRTKTKTLNFKYGHGKKSKFVTKLKY